MVSKRLISLLFVAFLLLFTVEPGFTMAPEDYLQEKIDEVLSILEDTDLMSSLKSDTVREQLVDLAREDFDFEEMTFRALGPYARQATDEQIDQLVDLFSKLLTDVYVNRLTGDLAEEAGGDYQIVDITLGDTQVTRDGRYARVHTRAEMVLEGDRQVVRLMFSLIAADPGWKIYDFEVEGIGLVQNYRRQFSNILARNSIDYLIDLLKQRVEDDDPTAAPDELVPLDKVE